MANLNAQTIRGTNNYKGLLNLDSTIGTPLDATLRAVTDGMGTSSPLQLSTTSIQFGSPTGLFWNNTTSRLGIGTNSPLGVLHLKTTGATTRLLLDGDAGQSKIITYRTLGLQRFGLYTNNTAESGSNVGSDFQIRAYNDAGTLLSTPVFIKRSTGFVGINTLNPTSNLSINGDITAISGTNGIQSLTGTFSAAAGSANFRPLNIAYTINNSGAQTGNATGLFLNATETALNGMTHNLMDLQVGGVSMLKVANSGLINCGQITSSSFVSCGIGQAFVITGRLQIRGGASDGITTFQDSSGSSFNRLNLGGTTSSFPAIKRNGAAIDFRLADDSAACNISVNNVIATSSVFASNTILHSSGYIVNTTTTNTRLNVFTNGVSVENGASNVIAASAIFELKSTTQGFLMPRQTQAQILAIAAPANGLQVYNTDLAQPCFYDGTGWKKVNHSPM
jgi:hypothetical protein